MDLPRPPKSVRRITLLQIGAAGEVKSLTLYRDRSTGRQKRGSPLLHEVERLIYTIVRAEQAVVNAYVSEHKKSNRRKSDGWLQDLPSNVAKAGKKGLDQLNIDPLA